MSGLIGLIGVAFVVLPFFIGGKFTFIHLISICIGFAFMGVTRANDISLLSSKEAVGDDFIKDVIRWIVKRFKRNK